MKPADNNTNDRIGALSALYQGGRTDSADVSNVSMMLMVIGGAYLVGAITFADKMSHWPFAWLFLLLLPLPTWIMAAHHSILTLCGMSLGTSIRIIEDKLFEESGLHVKREMIGSCAGDRIIDITKQHVVHKLISVIVYGGVGFLGIGFTVYSLYLASEATRENTALANVPVIGIAAIIYSFIGCIVLLSWVVGIRMIAKGHADLEAQTKRLSVKKN
jgi:hypothetical protein